MAMAVTSHTVVSCTAFPPLPERDKLPFWRYISVALALESPPPDVIRHPALRSPDFPHLIENACAPDKPRSFTTVAVLLYNGFVIFSRLSSKRLPLYHKGARNWQGSLVYGYPHVLRFCFATSHQIGLAKQNLRITELSKHQKEPLTDLASFLLLLFNSILWSRRFLSG